jgi:ribosomal protein L37AE/L43A
MHVFAKMKTVNKEEQVTRSHFIDCPNCKTHTLKLKRVVQIGRCKNCHESYKIVIVYVKEGRKPRPAAKTPTASTVTSPDSTLPSWQVPSDSSLFGSSSTETNSIFSDFGSSFGKDDQNRETSTGNEQ